MAFSKPVEIPTWATAGVRMDPGAAKKALGWVQPEPPPDVFFNWLLGVTGDWVEFLDDKMDPGAVDSLVLKNQSTGESRIDITLTDINIFAFSGGSSINLQPSGGVLEQAVHGAGVNINTGLVVGDTTTTPLADSVLVQGGLAVGDLTATPGAGTITAGTAATGALSLVPDFLVPSIRFTSDGLSRLLYNKVANTFNFVVNNTTAFQLRYNAANNQRLIIGSDGYALNEFDTTKELNFSAGDGFIWTDVNDTLTLRANSTNNYSWSPTSFFPVVDDDASVGARGFRFTGVYGMLGSFDLDRQVPPDQRALTERHAQNSTLVRCHVLDGGLLVGDHYNVFSTAVVGLNQYDITLHQNIDADCQLIVTCVSSSATSLAAGHAILTAPNIIRVSTFVADAANNMDPDSNEFHLVAIGRPETLPPQ